MSSLSVSNQDYYITIKLPVLQHYDAVIPILRHTPSMHERHQLHIPRTHSSSGFPSYPSLQAQTGLWSLILQSALGPQLHGAIHTPRTQALSSGQSASLTHSPINVTGGVALQVPLPLLT